MPQKSSRRVNHTEKKKYRYLDRVWLKSSDPYYLSSSVIEASGIEKKKIARIDGTQVQVSHTFFLASTLCFYWESSEAFYSVKS